MMHSRLFRAISRLLVIPLIFSMVLGMTYTPTFHTEPVYAGGIVYDPTNWIQNALSAAASRFIGSLTDALVVKDYVLDGIAFAIINMMIAQMSQDIISWINSGFQGDPAFIRDFDGLLTGVADRAVGEFIGGTELGNYLCSPFRIRIQAALEIQYAATRNFGAPANTCTLSGIEDNIDDFLNGDVVMGSWDDWFRITQNPQYNTHGALLMAQEKLSMNITNAKSQEATILGWGNGLLSSRECVGGTEYYDPDTDQMRCPGGYSVVTPGTAIEDSLNEALAAPGQRIQAADEINEIFAALFNQLVTQAFSGIGGLLGLTGSSGSAPRNPYYTTLYTQPSGSESSNLGTRIQESIATETRYRDLQQTIATMLTNAANYRENTYPGDSCHSGALTPALQNELTTALGNLALANTSLGTLNQIYAEFLAAGDDPELIRLVSQRYVNVALQLHTNSENDMIASLGIRALQDAINSFIAEVDQACQSSQFGQQ